MIIISIHNIEKLIFFNSKVWPLFPEFQHIFKQWLDAIRSGVSAKKSLFDLMQLITDEHLKRLEQFFNSPVQLEKTDPSIVKNYIVHVDKVKETLAEHCVFQNLSISRDRNQIYISLWR